MPPTPQHPHQGPALSLVAVRSVAAPRRPAPRLLVAAGLAALVPGLAGVSAAETPAAAPHPFWDPESGAGVRWTAELGSETYGGPTVAGGRVFVGTNNQRPRDPAAAGDRGVVMAFDAADGTLLWQATTPKADSDRDWPLQGVCSTPAVAGDRVYWVSNRGELVAADVEGLADGEDDGPHRDERPPAGPDTGPDAGPANDPATGPEKGSAPAAADLVWQLDLVAELGAVPRFMSASSPLVAGDRLWVGTGNGIDDRGGVPAPAAPSLVAVDRTDGRLLWSDASPGDGLVDGGWASPVLTAAGGTGGTGETVLFPAGDGRLYAFDAASGERRWSFDANDGCAEPGCRRPLVGGVAVAGGRAFFGLGRDPQYGADPGRLWALELGAEPRPLWSVGGEEFGLTLSTPVVEGGLVYTADLAGFVYCFDAASGALRWKYDAFAEIWGSPRLAGGRVYIGDADGDLTVFAAGGDGRPLAEVNLGATIHTTPAVEDGTLYVATRERLWALVLPPPSPPTAPPMPPTPPTPAASPAAEG